MSKQQLNKSIISLSICLFLAPIAVHADGYETPTDSAQRFSNKSVAATLDIDEIVVVAQPKERFLLWRQPVSSNSYSQGDMNALGAGDLRDLSSYVPAFVMPQYGTRYTSSIYMRGLGARINSPAVGLYVDGVPLLNKGAHNFHNYQIDRIDVLRGPQGTIYGQNNEAGLIRLFTRDPSHYRGTDILLSAGSHFHRNIEAAHYFSLGSFLSASVAAYYLGTNGYQKNQTTGQRADNSDEGGARLRMVYSPASPLSIDWSADWQYTHERGFAYGDVTPEGYADNASAKYDLATAAPANNAPNNYRRNVFNTALSIDWQGDDHECHSTTSFQHLGDNMNMDIDYGPQPFMRMHQEQRQNAITQEFTYKTDHASRYNRVIGVYGSYQWTRTQAPVMFDEGITEQIATPIQSAMYNAILQKMAAAMVAQGLPEAAAQGAAASAIEKAGGVSMDVAMQVPGLFHTPYLNLAAFHESNTMITDRLTLVFGKRLDFTRASVKYDTRALMQLHANVMGKEATYELLSKLKHSHHDSWLKFLPKVALRYDLDDKGSSLYISYSRGYRAGGYNIQMFSDILQAELNANRANVMSGNYEVEHTENDYKSIRKTIEYKPETTDNFEIGAHLKTANGKFVADVSAFYLDIRNQQLSVMSGQYGFGRMMVNSGRSYSCGFDVALRAVTCADRLSMSLNYSLTRAAFKQYRDSIVTGTTSEPVNYHGKRVPYVPMHTLSAAITYRQPVASSVVKAVAFSANAYAQGNTYWDEANTLRQPFYIVPGARIDIEMPHVTLSLWGRNLSDTRYNTFATVVSTTGTDRVFANQGRPISFGADVRINF